MHERPPSTAHRGLCWGGRVWALCPLTPLACPVHPTCWQAELRQLVPVYDDGVGPVTSLEKDSSHVAGALLPGCL